MDEDFLIKKIYDISSNELLSVGFDKDYIEIATNKYKSNICKIYALSAVQATILKQTALSCGTDCAVHRDVLTHNVEFSDAILFATDKQLKQIIQKLYVQPFKLKILAKNLENILNNKLQPMKIKNKIFDWEKPYIMGILNYTDNSFSDGGEFNNKEDAFNHFNKLVSEGADIIDIGAESTAHDNEKINVEEEIKRLNGILPLIRQNDIPVSIDTRNSKTARMVLDAGADIINDVSGLCHDEKMAEMISPFNPFVILTFDDEINNYAIDETIKGLITRVEKAVKAGIKKEKIIIDPGIGFNKTYEQNFELVKYAGEICSIGFPVLYGVSRKSFIQKITSLPPKETELANISLASYLISKGVNILRVHDVKSHKIAIDVLKKVL